MRSGAVLQFWRGCLSQKAAQPCGPQKQCDQAVVHTPSPSLVLCTLLPLPWDSSPLRDLSGPSPPDSHHTNLGGSYILSWKERTISVCFFFPPPFTCGPGSTMIFNVRNEEQPHLGSGVRSTDSRCVLVGLEQRGEQPQASTKNLNTSYRRLFRVISTLH